MKLSYVIPAYNEEQRIAGCLEALLQDIERTPELSLGTNAEVVVVNNASSDRTREVAESCTGVRVVDEPKKGLVQARHAGFKATTGELVANIDADTIMPEGWTVRVLSEFAHNPKLVALSGPYLYYDLPLLSRALVRLFYMGGWLIYIVSHRVFGGTAMLQGGNFILKRDAFLQVGGFDTTISFYGEDTDVARRIARVGRVKWTFGLPMHTSGRRLAEEGLVSTGTRYAANFFSVIFSGRVWTSEYTDIR